MSLTEEKKQQLIVNPKVTHIMADGSIRDSLKGYCFNFNSTPLQMALQIGLLKM